MKTHLLILALLTSGFSFAELPSKLPEQIFDLPVLERKQPVRNMDQLESQIYALNSVIGRYPPAYTTQEQREKTYALWSDLLQDANAMPQGSEAYFFLNAQLYRQGHNMDVRHAAKKSDELLQSCITAYETSEKCHLEASFFYLQIAPPNLKLAKTSLDTLREMYQPAKSEEVEAGYVFLHLYSRDNDAAYEQISSYVKEFPDAGRVEMFRRIQAALDNGGIELKSE